MGKRLEKSKLFTVGDDQGSVCIKVLLTDRVEGRD